MITELIQHLQNSPIAGRPLSVMRDDDLYPFKDQTLKPILIRQQPGSVDRDIGAAGYDIYIHSEGGTNTSAKFNVSNGEVINDATALMNWLLVNSRSGDIYGIDVTGGVGGPFRDGQNRAIASISINVRRSTALT